MFLQPGVDINPGTILQPWRTWTKAFYTARPGDTVYFRGGVYPIEVTSGLGIRYIPADGNKGYDGTEGNYICYYNYPGETPILDCSSVGASFNNALYLSGVDYVNFRGLHIRDVKQRISTPDLCLGINSTNCHHIKFENMVIYNIDGVGYSSYDMYYAEFVNCDAYDCVDLYAPRPGDWGSGFANGNQDFDDGYVNYVGCRAWNCSDQGFTSGASRSLTVYDNCWSFNNGNDPETAYPLFGDGHGFKIGYPETARTTEPVLVMRNCVAAYNAMDGLTFNDVGYHAQSAHIYNNMFYKSGRFGVIVENTVSSDDQERKRILRNNIAYQSTSSNFYAPNAYYTSSNNTWDASVTVTTADFVSLDYSQLVAARNADFSLPNTTFGKLASTSDLVDAGIDVGLSYQGSAPDIGWYETSMESSIPEVPIYSYSTIENATPSRLEMTYNLTLANIVPAASCLYCKG